jgi:hypothetical protein
MQDIPQNYNVNTTHPLIQNSQDYIYYKKYVSIHSEDRDMIKYPNSSEFEIELPEDITNVSTMRLTSWTFSSNYSAFSNIITNTTMTFKINNPYNPNINNIDDLLLQKTFEFLHGNINTEFKIQIQEGFYNPQQIVSELTNRINSIVTQKLNHYFTEQSLNLHLDPDPIINKQMQEEYIQANLLLTSSDGYQNFVVVYNNVSQKIWFGNICDGFILTNETQFLKNTLTDNLYCGVKSQSPDFSNWGLPGNIGLNRCNTESVSGVTAQNNNEIVKYGTTYVPRFFYGDVFPGDNGFWLLPNNKLIHSNVYWVECVYKINLMGPAYMYMELNGHNCIDETSPYNVSEFTLKTNGTNGVVNSAFAKMSVPTTPISQWFDRDSLPYKFYYPPADRIRRFKVKIRYHNGQIVDFGIFNFSFMLEFTTLLPQILRKTNAVKTSMI